MSNDISGANNGPTDSCSSSPDMLSRNLYIHNVPRGATEDDLKEFFRHCGTIERVQLRVNQKVGPNAVYAFVLFSTPEEAKKCFDEMNGSSMHGRPIRVEYQRNPRIDDDRDGRRGPRGRGGKPSDRGSRGGMAPVATRGRGGRHYDEGPRDGGFGVRGGDFRGPRLDDEYGRDLRCDRDHPPSKRPRYGEDFGGPGDGEPLPSNGPIDPSVGLQNTIQQLIKTVANENATVQRVKLALCDLVRLKAPHVFTRSPIPDPSIQHISSQSMQQQQQMHASIQQQVGMANSRPGGSPNIAMGSAYPQQPLQSGGIRSQTSVQQHQQVQAVQGFMGLQQPGVGMPGNANPASGGAYKMGAAMQAVHAAQAVQAAQAAQQRTVTPLCWTGHIARNEKKRVPVQVLIVRGNVGKFIHAGVQLLNVSHRSKWDEIASKAIYAVCYLQVSQPEHNRSFYEYIEYFMSKDRAGVASLDADHYLYLVPPGVALFEQYKPPNHPQNILLGLIGPSQQPTAIQQDPQKTNQPPVPQQSNGDMASWMSQLSHMAAYLGNKK